MVNKRTPFEKLREADTEKKFNLELLGLINVSRFTVLSVVMDKKEHLERYTVWQHDPYHYCLQVLTERYVMWLERNNYTGDVLAESRGGKEDMRLKRSFEKVWSDGTGYITHDRIINVLTSSQLKVKSKQNNIAGLQLADLIAHPSYKSMLSRRNNQALPDNFGGMIAKILEDEKYDRSPDGKIDGWGRKWLP